MDFLFWNDLKSWLPSSFQKARDCGGKWGLEVKDKKS